MCTSDFAGVFEFLILLGRSADRKELEILVHWTYERRVRGRPPLDAERVALILRLARERRRDRLGGLLHEYELAA